jgi:hypothetical protein
MDKAVTTPTVLELTSKLEPITHDEFADEPAEHRRPPRLDPVADPEPGHGERQE